MRIVGVLLVLALGAGCKNKGDADAATSDPNALKAQQDLVARRDALMAERKKLETTLQGLDTQIADKKSKGEDITDLEKQRTDILSQTDTKKTEQSSLESKIDQINSASGGLAAREAALAELERRLRADIDALNEKQREFVKMQVESQRLWQQQCTAPTQIVVPSAPVNTGANFSRSDAEQMYSRAKSAIAKKGLLMSDLGTAASLDGEVQTALGKKDWVNAYFHAQTLAKQVETIKIDRAFTDAKYNRLAGLVRKNTDATVQKQLEDGMSEIVKLRAAGNYNAVNAKLNALFGLVR